MHTSLSSARPTPDERRILYLKYDGPIPPTALEDLRRNPPQPFSITALSDMELTQWQTLARHNLKTAQRCLAWRRTRRTASPHTCQNGIKWSLAQCRNLRRTWRTFVTERTRRTREVTRLAQHRRALNAISQAMGLDPRAL